MKIGVISDAHGNVCGLRKCIDSLQDAGVDEILHLGDSVGYFPDANEVLQELESARAVCLMGNHEAMLLGLLELEETKDKDYRIAESRARISGRSLNRISGWVPFCERTVDGRRLLFVHGSPWDPLNGYIYPDSDLRMFGNLEFDSVFMGHTHLPFKSQVCNVLVANAGSCALPRDHGSLLSSLIYDTERSVCEIVRIRYDVEEIVERYGAKISKIVLDCLMRK